MFFKKELKRIRITKPILILGLPGIANIARISSDFLIQTLKAKKIATYYSHNFPALVVINDDSTVEIPTIDIYHTKKSDQDIIFVIGNMQPIEEHAYEFCERLLKDYKPTKIITIGGIGANTKQHDKKIHLTTNNKKIFKQMEKYDLIADGNETVSMILGMTGLLIGVARLHNIDGISLLAETSTDAEYLGLHEARNVLEILMDYMNIKIDLNKLGKEAEVYQKELMKRKVTEDTLKDYYGKLTEPNTNYIG